MAYYTRINGVDVSLNISGIRTDYSNGFKSRYQGDNGGDYNVNISRSALFVTDTGLRLSPTFSARLYCDYDGTLFAPTVAFYFESATVQKVVIANTNSRSVIIKGEVTRRSYPNGILMDRIILNHTKGPYETLTLEGNFQYDTRGADIVTVNAYCEVADSSLLIHNSDILEESWEVDGEIDESSTTTT